MNDLKVAVLGAGNGALAMAGHLGLQGFPIRLYNKFAEEIADVQANQGVTVEGEVEGFGPVEMATTDPAPVVSWADVILVVVPAFVHRFIAEACAPHLHDGQIVLLNPGRTGGALEFANVLQKQGVQANIHLAEAQSLVYACRISGPGRVNIKGIKRQMPVATFPAITREPVMEKLARLYPQFTPVANVLETGLDNIGAVFHPAAVVLNTNSIEAGVEHEFYMDMTPTVAHFLEVIDRERLLVARAFGVTLDSAREWLLKNYEGVIGQNLYECLQSNQAYKGIKGPSSINTRALLEDVPTGLVPLVSLGELAGVATPASRAVVNMAAILLDRDFWGEGRSASNLGLAGMSVDEIRRFVNTGVGQEKPL